MHGNRDSRTNLGSRPERDKTLIIDLAVKEQRSMLARDPTRYAPLQWDALTQQPFSLSPRTIAT